MIKKIFFVICFFFNSLSVFANLYVTTSFYQDSEKKPIVTKHHLFLNQPYDIRYWKITYTLTLKKVSKDLIVIEHETNLVKPLSKEFLSAGIWSGKLADQMQLKQFDKNSKLKFGLTLIPEKIVDTRKD